MKRIVLTGMIFLSSVGFGFGQSGQNELPQEARNFINTHFAQVTIEETEKNDSWYDLDKNEMYEVKLSNGTKLDFNREGEVTEIDGEERIPDAALPSPIVAYVEANFSGAHIVGWELDDDEQEVELSDGTELEFNLEDQFLKED